MIPPPAAAAEGGTTHLMILLGSRTLTEAFVSPRRHADVNDSTRRGRQVGG